MKIINFFENKPVKINKLFQNKTFKNNILIKNIKSLNNAKKNDLTFFDSIKYKSIASKTKASFCITTKKLELFLPHKTEKIIVQNVLYELASILKKIYPFADIDYPDLSLTPPLQNKTSWCKIW